MKLLHFHPPAGRPATRWHSQTHTRCPRRRSMRRIIRRLPPQRPGNGRKETALILADETRKKGLKWAIDFFCFFFFFYPPSLPRNITASMRCDVNKDRGINESDAHVGLRTCWPTRSVVHQPGRNHSFHLFFFCCFVFLTAHRRDVSAATSVINELKQPQIDPWKRLSEAFQREKERGAIDWSAWLLSFFTEISLRNEELSHSRL